LDDMTTSSHRLLLRPAEVADALGLGRTKVYTLLAQGDLPSVRIGGAVRVPVDALRLWVERHAGPTEQATRGARTDDTTP
jgi:excisionase family DNA binding protein